MKILLTFRILNGKREGAKDEEKSIKKRFFNGDKK